MFTLLWLNWSSQKNIDGISAIYKLVGSVSSAIFCWDECGIQYSYWLSWWKHQRPNLTGLFSPVYLPAQTLSSFCHGWVCSSGVCISVCSKTSSDYKFQICQSVGPGKQVIFAHQRDLIAEEDSLGEELAPTLVPWQKSPDFFGGSSKHCKYPITRQNQALWRSLSPI